MSESVFNPEQFMQTTTEAVGDTKYYPCPIGEWRGQIESVKARQIESDKSGETRIFYSLDILWTILDEEPRRATETEGDKKLLVRQGIFIDLTAAGALDFGKNKNVPLSRLREALGQQRAGRPWGPSHLVGGLAVVSVIHRPREDTGDPVAEVKGVIAAK